MPNFQANASPLVKNPSFDKGNVYTMAWQSGMTGIGYDPKRAGREITSWQDLQDPAFKGKIGMFGDTADLPNCALLAVGVNPETSTEADWKKAADWLKKQQPLVRKYYVQDYIDPLSKGDIWVSMAWSGDIFQANASGASLKFVVPKEGAAIWTDNMCIPKYAAHPRDAMTYMDYVYQPKIAAMLAEYINYITPVATAKQVIQSDAGAAKGEDKTYLEGLAASPLIFPSEADFSRLHRYRVLTAAEEKVWNALFEPIFQS
jgi:spermidine/putrescine transport system substrate-binding protein